MLKVKAKSLKTAWELVRRIKIGSIRPTESYEGQQQGKSRPQLEADLAELQSRIEEIERLRLGAERQLEIEQSEAILAGERVKAVQKFAAELVNKKLQWPWCSKRAVADKIILAVNAG
ncbi:MAG: hypothetical protein NTZ38_02275 [Candidatus Taylorbacteria bacterium]|nr:hypothetical protein [Candidatus Taylorbacteria bacterium]